MKFRWTTDDLKESDAFILRGLVAERKSTLNPYSPLAKRLSQLYDTLNKQVENERLQEGEK